MNKLAVVFACDDNYALPFAVVLESLLINRKKGTYYDVYCLVPESFSANNLEKLNTLEEKYEDFTLNFIDLGNKFKNTAMSIEHISYVTYFRLLLPELLISYDKCLYLDVDMIITEDLTELFATDLDGFYLGAVKHPLLFHRTKIKQYSISDNSYFNAGMLLMNLELLRKDNMQSKFIELMKEQFAIQDQDVLNIACNKKVKFLALKYNMMIKTCEFLEQLKSIKVYENDFFDAKRAPIIIHYANKEKPWQYNNLKFSQQWNDVFSQSIFSDLDLNQKRVSLTNLFFRSTVNLVKTELLKVYLVYKLNKFIKKVRKK